MTDELISQIQSFTLSARAALETEASQQLEGIYGWLPDGSFGSAKGYPALGTIDEARETRQRLEQFVEDEKPAGLDAKSSRRKLIREAAFTWLNRFAAFRLMEERKLLKQTIVRLAQSNGFIFWLTDEKVPQGQEAYALHQQGALPLNAMGEGPADVAYRDFLLWQCAELARDASVLFDPNTLASRLCPRPPVLKQLVTEMNANALVDAWKIGNEETVGWLYQAFNSQELQAAFAAARESKKKFESADIPAVTQLFTTRWVVRFLVENTLGRLWVEMHPDSALKEELGYLVPVQKSNRMPKPAREVTFLDPCCGSMHFGLVAFDLFVRMYREEIANAGKPGWTAKPSVAADEEIASSIVENNIFGIDLDLRAVQLSALTLLLRARTQTPKCKFTDQNFACANVEQLTGGRLDELITATKFHNCAEERILRALAARIADSPNLGSLLRLETDLNALVDAERKQMLASTQPELLFSGLTEDLFATTHDLNAFFDELTESLAERLDNYARSSVAGAVHVAHEASKGLRYLRLVQRRYDIVATNPPYLSNRKMNERLQKLLGEQYNTGKQDLFAAFILRCQELLAPQGLVGMLTMHSYMFISSYEEMRNLLRSEVAIETLAHFGGGLFAVGNPGTLQTAAFVLRKEPDKKSREENEGLYFRLVRERDAEAKRAAFENAVAALRGGNHHQQLFACEQSAFNAIPGKPWVYWIPAKVRKVFGEHPQITSIAKPKHGMATADNFRFVRKWFEIGRSAIGFGCLTKEAASQSQKKWFPYMKGGPVLSWYGNLEHVVNYGNDGYELKAWTAPLYNNSGWSRSLVSMSYYFHRGVTWSLISSKGFAARISPGGFVFDVAGMTCFPPEDCLKLFLAVLNSHVANFLLSAINPTINFQVCDIERLPLPGKQTQAIENLVDRCLELARQHCVDRETTYDFVCPPRATADVASREEELNRCESQIDSEVSRLYGLSSEDLAAIQRELGHVPATRSEADEKEGEDEVSEDATWSEQTLARAWISYAVGTVLGRYAIGDPNGLGRGEFDPQTIDRIRNLIDADGLMVAEKDHPQDIVKRVLECLNLMLGSDIASATIRIATEGDSNVEDLLREWIDRQFWKYHHQLYRKRPIYWSLQSPKKKFTVWIFHERISKDTLFQVRDQFVQVKVNWLNSRIRDLQPKADSSDTRERRAAEKEISQLSDTLDEVQEFAERLKRITERGYTPHIDDGVLLNAAPLSELLPAWKEADKAWKELEAGEYDWARQAMEYWPERVKKACETNKSFAIAQGLA